MNTLYWQPERILTETHTTIGKHLMKDAIRDVHVMLLLDFLGIHNWRRKAHLRKW